jgi:hypothetical protein
MRHEDESRLQESSGVGDWGWGYIIIGRSGSLCSVRDL